MKRKVIKHGPSTLIISLPTRWAKLNNVSKGEEVNVQEQGSSLIISADSGDEKQLTANVDITGLDRTSILFAIRSLYRLGYDTVNVKFNNEQTTYFGPNKKMGVLSVIHHEVDRLIGYEVIQERRNYCVIKDLESVSGQDFDQVLRRIFLLILDASEGFVQSAISGNKTLLKTTEHHHNVITKFASYCMRILNKRGHFVPMATLYYHHIIAMLDKVTDVIKYAARDVQKINGKLNPSVVAILKACNQHLRSFYELFYAYDQQKIVKLSTSRYEIQKKVRSLPSSISHGELFVAANFAQIAEQVLDLIEARAALEHATRPD